MPTVDQILEFINNDTNDIKKLQINIEILTELKIRIINKLNTINNKYRQNYQ